jgi:Ring finger domain
MTMEERKKYVERTIVCKRYESQPLAEFTVFADSRVDAKISDEDTCDVTTIKHKCERMQQQPPQCAICLEQFMDGDMIVESSSINMDCMHEFHRNCIHQWCMFQTNCPCCRRELLFLNNISILNENDDENQTLANDSFRSV